MRQGLICWPYLDSGRELPGPTCPADFWEDLRVAFLAESSGGPRGMRSTQPLLEFRRLWGGACFDSSQTCCCWLHPLSCDQVDPSSSLTALLPDPLLLRATVPEPCCLLDLAHSSRLMPLSPPSIQGILSSPPHIHPHEAQSPLRLPMTCKS